MLERIVLEGAAWLRAPLAVIQNYFLIASAIRINRLHSPWAVKFETKRENGVAILCLLIFVIFDAHSFFTLEIVLLPQ